MKPYVGQLKVQNMFEAKHGSNLHGGWGGGVDIQQRQWICSLLLILTLFPS